MRKSRSIPGTPMTGYGKSITRGGGSETIEWVSNGPMRLTRSVSRITTAFADDRYQPTDVSLFIGPGHQMYDLNDRSDSEMSSLGTTAIARSLPTNPSFSLLTAAGEIARDGIALPPGWETWRDRTSRAKKAGSEYLNVEFGWKPLITEIGDFARTVRRSSEILENYRSRANRDIKVGYGYPEEVQGESYTTGFSYADVNMSALGGCIGSLTKTSSRRAWFEGTYRYPLPVGDSAFATALRYGKEANKLLGIFPTPSVIWELSPWSWAVDWFTNTGDILANVSAMAVDGLVLTNGFMMAHTRTEMIGQAIKTDPYYTWIKGLPATQSLSETKKRNIASPFAGFGVSGDLSARQIAILAALGISRA